MGEALSFYCLALIISLFSVAVVTIKKPVVAVILLVFNLFFLAGIYALLGADFVAVIQIIIYAGAILVLFMFVIMLLNPDLSLKYRGKKIGTILIFGLLLLGFASFSYKMFKSSTKTLTSLASTEITHDNTYEIALKLFEKYLWPFEIASVLILVAIVSSILISRKPIKTKKLKEI